MGISVRVSIPSSVDVELSTAIRRGERLAGEQILAASDALAPREPVPRHGQHMTETGFTLVVPDPVGDTIVVGYEAFWSVWQNEDLSYHHPHGGQAKFLDLALLGGAERAMETIAASVREVIR